MQASQVSDVRVSYTVYAKTGAGMSRHRVSSARCAVSQICGSVVCVATAWRDITGVGGGACGCEACVVLWVCCVRCTAPRMTRGRLTQHCSHGFGSVHSVGVESCVSARHAQRKPARMQPVDISNHLITFYLI
jgi:hypothetical protein